MIPLTLRLKGIYSYQEEQSIDFSRLTDAHIFGIFGQVGSGKSTILEAISFALYGETERLNLRDNRNYNMMNLRSDDLLIDYTFIIGPEKSEYRFIVKGKRNKQQFDKVGTYTRTAHKKEGNHWIPIELNDVESIVGLNYENFRRTMIIPQNQFQEFLELGDSDRTKMMKALFQLDKFELSSKVATLEQKTKLERNTVEARLIQIGEVTSEQIKEKERQFKLLKEKIANDEGTLKTKQKAELDLKGLKDTFDKVTLQKKNVADLEKQEPGINKLENSIQEFEKCQINFKGLLENNKSVSTKIRTKTEEIRLLGIKHKEDLDLIAKRENDFQMIKPRYETRDQLKSKSNEFEKIIKIIQLEADQRELTDKIKVGDAFIKEKVALQKEFSTQQKTHKADLINLKKTLPDLSELSAIREWFTIKKGFHKAIDTLGTEVADILSDITAASKTQNKIISPVILKLIPELSNGIESSEKLKKLREGKIRIKNQIDEVDASLQLLSGKNELEKYAKSLKDGDPCTLCGSKEHPHILNLSDVSTAIKKANQSKSVYYNNRELIDQAIQDLTTSLKQVETYTVNVGRVRKKDLIEKANLERHLKQFKWRNFEKDNEGVVTAAFKEAEGIQREIEKKEASLNTIDKENDKNNVLKDKAESKLKNIREQLSGIISSINLLNGQLKLLKYPNYKTFKIERLEKNISELNTEYIEVGRSYVQIERELNKLKGEVNTLNGRIESEKKGLGEHQKNQKDLNEKINKQLKKHEYPSIEKVEIILNQNFNINQERKRITEYRNNLHAAKESLKILNEQIGTKKYNEDYHSKLKEEIQSLAGKLDKLKGDKGSADNEIKLLIQNLQLRESLVKKQTELILRDEDINILKRLFKGSGFVNYVSSVYLQNICKAANLRFQKLTRQRLELEITETNNFQIRDFLNDGQVRNVKTLSGGQKFQAALSLALALADNIQKLTRSNQNFFFLDEGFGALDKESLQIAFEALKSLRKENRIVGVISHVEEMQQEIDTYLLIVNKEEGGSEITASWNKN